METLLKPAATESAPWGDPWVNPTNAFGISADGAFTAGTPPTGGTHRFGFEAIGPEDIPDDSTVSAVRVAFLYRRNDVAWGFSYALRKTGGLVANGNGLAPYGEIGVWTPFVVTFPGVTLADLRAGNLAVDAWNGPDVDYIRLEVDFTPPPVTDELVIQILAAGESNTFLTGRETVPAGSGSEQVAWATAKADEIRAQVARAQNAAINRGPARPVELPLDMPIKPEKKR